MLPASILRAETVKKQLTSGLTTAFIGTFEEREISGRKLRGAMRIEIRYELWDETYLVNVIDGEGRKQKAVLASLEKLIEWLGRTPLRLARATRASEAPSTIRLKVEMLPFSATEEADAQRWLAQSVGDSSGSRQNDSGSQSTSSSGILDLIIGTSVQRRPIVSWRWTVRVDTGAR